MKKANYLWAVLIPMLIIFSCTKSKSTKPEITSGYKLDKFYIETELPSYVNIMFQVTDIDGAGVDNLVTADFRVIEDGESVSPTESYMQIRKRDMIPYSLKTVLLIDNSASVGTKLNVIKEAADALVQNITDQQEIAIFEFSDAPVLIQDFTSDVALLSAAINSIELGYASTDLYGALIEGLSQWEDFYDLSGIQQGFLIALTDGSDTQNSHTLAEALEARGDKWVYTIGLGDEIDPGVLNTLGNAGSYLINNADEVVEKFAEIQAEIVAYANSLYWLNYLSPTRGDADHTIKLVIIDNENTGSGSYIQDTFNSEDFYSVNQGIYINVSENNPYGINSLDLPHLGNYILHAESFLCDLPPQYVWTTPDTNIVMLEENPDADFMVFILASGGSGDTATIAVEDTVNNLTKNLFITITNHQVFFFEGFEESEMPEGWSTSGNAEWFVTGNNPLQGDYCIQTDHLQKNWSTYLSKSYTIPEGAEVTISFARKTTSIYNTDLLTFYIDNMPTESWGGENNWDIVEYNHTINSSGVLDLRWRYIRNYFSNCEFGTALLDNIEISW